MIPVIDLLAGQVVRGVGGRRHDYRPIESRICASAEPGHVARTLVERFHASELYVADLDAIGGVEPDWSSLAAIASAGASVLLDAGVDSTARLDELTEREFPAGARTRRPSIVIGLESVPNVEFARRAFERLGPQRAIFSLDLREGQPLARSEELRERSPEWLVAAITAIGFRRLIVLDLAAVGEPGGLRVEALCRHVCRVAPEVELISGGGVRGREDVAALHEAGCHGVLVASALHDGRLLPGEIPQAGPGLQKPGAPMDVG